MSWGSRFSGWAPSRWSPFSSRGDPSNSTVTDKDFSYITAEDLNRHDRGHDRNHDREHRHHHQHEPRRSSNLHESRAPRDADILVLRHQRTTHSVHFPAYSIDDCQLNIGDVREQAARALNVPDPRRIRMFYKGRVLKDDKRQCLDEGFRSDVASDILCVISDASREHSFGSAPRDAQSESDAADDDDDEDGDDGSDGAQGSTLDHTASGTSSTTKKKKRRSRKKKSKKPSAPTSAPTTSASTSASAAPVVEHLPIPTGTHPLHRTTPPGTNASTPASSSRPPTPQTPRQKLDAIAATFHDTLAPQCRAYIDAPPADPAKRAFEHKRLSESVLAQVLLKLDGVETEGDDAARAQRKALVKDVQAWLADLDDVVKHDQQAS